MRATVPSKRSIHAGTRFISAVCLLAAGAIVFGRATAAVQHVATQDPVLEVRSDQGNGDRTRIQELHGSHHTPNSTYFKHPNIFPDHSLRFQLVDPDGVPLTNAVVELFWNASGLQWPIISNPNPPYIANSTSSGECTVSIDSNAAWRRGIRKLGYVYWITYIARCPGYIPVTGQIWNLRAREGEPTVVKFERRSQILPVKAVDENGVPVLTARVSSWIIPKWARGQQQPIPGVRVLQVEVDERGMGFLEVDDDSSPERKADMSTLRVYAHAPGYAPELINQVYLGGRGAKVPKDRDAVVTIILKRVLPARLRVSNSYAGLLGGRAVMIPSECGFPGVEIVELDESGEATFTQWSPHCRVLVIFPKRGRLFADFVELLEKEGDVQMIHGKEK